MIIKTNYPPPACPAPKTSITVQPDDTMGGHRTEVRTDNEATQLTDRHFELAILRQQGTTAKTTDWGRDYPIQADLGGNPNIATTAQVAAREEAAIGQHRQGNTSSDENKQNDRGRRTVDPFISAKWPCCILYALLCVFFFLFYLPCNFPCCHARY